MLWYYTEKWSNLPTFEFNLLPSDSVSRKKVPSHYNQLNKTQILYISDVSFSNFCWTTFWPMGRVIFNFVRKTLFLAKIEKQWHFGGDFQPLNEIVWNTFYFHEKPQEKLSKIAVCNFVFVSIVVPLKYGIKFLHLNFTN